MISIKGKRYEGGFFANFKYWARYYDEILEESFITDEVPQKWEFYKPDPNGSYKSIYDNTRYSLFTGSSQDAKAYGCTAQVSPIDLAIRELFHGTNNLNPRIMYLDIETRVGTVVKGFPDPAKALEPVSLIQFLDNKTQKVHLIGDKEFYYYDWYRNQPDHLGKEMIYHCCKNEIDMFELWFEFLSEQKPAVVYAWNGEGFDFAYLFNRAKRLNLDVSKFCPFWKEFGAGTGEKMGYVNAREQMFADRYSFDLNVGGCFYMDIKRLYQKLVFVKHPSYSLNYVAGYETGARKIQHEEFKTFEDFYQGNYQKPEKPTDLQKETLCYNMTIKGLPYEEIRKAGYGQFVYYGAIDVVLLQEIDKKVGLTALMTSVSNKMNSQYNSIMGTTKPWANYIRNVLYKAQLIITPETIAKRGANTEKSINGGFVRDPVTGKHEWVVSEDVNSMYPKLSIAGSNMSPDTFLFAWELGDSPAENKLKKFALEVLHVGDESKEQNEQNLLEYINDTDNKQQLSQLLKEANLAMAPNGTFYKKDHDGFIPRLVRDIYAERKTVKKQMFVKEQLAIKLHALLKQRGYNG